MNLSWASLENPVGKRASSVLCGEPPVVTWAEEAGRTGSEEAEAWEEGPSRRRAGGSGSRGAVGGILQRPRARTVPGRCWGPGDAAKEQIVLRLTETDRKSVG